MAGLVFGGNSELLGVKGFGFGGVCMVGLSFGEKLDFLGC